MTVENEKCVSTLNETNKRKHPVVDATIADFLTSLENVTEFVGMDAYYEWEQSGKEDDHLWNDVIRCRALFRLLEKNTFTFNQLLTLKKEEIA